MTIIASCAIDPQIPATVAFCDSQGSNSFNPSNRYSFSVNLGPVSRQRRTMIALVRTKNADLSTVGSIDDITVADTSFGLRFDCVNGPEHASLWSADIAGGTSGTLIISRGRGNGFEFAHFVLFAAYGLQSLVPTDVHLSLAYLIGTITHNTAIAFRGILVGMAFCEDGTKPFTWTGADKVSDVIVDGGTQRISGAIISKQQPAGTRAATFTTTTSSANAFSEQSTAAFA